MSLFGVFCVHDAAAAIRGQYLALSKVDVFVVIGFIYSCSNFYFL